MDYLGRLMARSRRPMTIVASVFGGGYLAVSYLRSKVDEMQDSLTRTHACKENLRRRFEQNQEDCSFTVEALIPTLGKQVVELMNVEQLAEVLSQTKKSRPSVQASPEEDERARGKKAGEGESDSREEHDRWPLSLEDSMTSAELNPTATISTQPVGSLPDALAGLLVRPDGSVLQKRSEIWREMMVLSFSRLFTSLYGVSLLALQTHVQLGLLGRDAYLSSILSAEKDAAAAGAHPPDEHALDTPTERRYLTFSYWYLHHGWLVLARRTRQAVVEVLGPRSLKDSVSGPELLELFGLVRQKVEFEADGRQFNFTPVLLPTSGSEELATLEQGGMGGREECGVDGRLRRLLDETQDFLDCPDFRVVLASAMAGLPTLPHLSGPSTTNQMAATTARARLDGLPPAALKTIFELEPALIHLFLVRLANHTLHAKTKAIVFQQIASQHQLTPILTSPSYADPVRALQLAIAPDPEQDAFLGRLLAKLPNLTSLHLLCAANNSQLTTIIATHAPSLSRFTTSASFGDSDSEAEHLQHKTTHRPIRWDAHAIDLLPPTITHLSIDSLSVIGARNLANAFHAHTWPTLTHLTLAKSLFIDDDLMAAVAIGSKKIRHISIQAMSGTKLTERGIELLFSGLDGLEEIELVDVEGRFSKLGWLKLDDLPPSLKSIKFGYHETGSYHSWTLDHLQNILSLLALYPHKLEHFSVTRFVPLPAMLPGKHASFPELACNNRTTPQRISKEQILSIVAQGNSLKELNLDWWLISVEGLEVIVKGLPNLRKLTALVDAPFHRIITSTVFVHSKIQTLIVSIPPEHTPLVQELSQVPMSPTIASGGGSPIATQQSPSCTVGSPGGIWGSQSSVSPIPTRDLKKFIKRAGHLKEIIWTGRGGLGGWKFVRNGPSALNVRVQFVPVAARLPPEALAYQHAPPPSGSSHHRAGSSPRQSFPPRNGGPPGTNIPGTPVAFHPFSPADPASLDPAPHHLPLIPDHFCPQKLLINQALDSSRTRPSELDINPAQQPPHLARSEPPSSMAADKERAPAGSDADPAAAKLLPLST
ncbi:hypothetical protein PtA15_17A308 [Puccinia triticina]|uniref:Peroxin-3 n=1 Tax=Puccinia triticina TaxID=208348 RepID=A0ABY7D5A6_9BASI|nr:uncharacterized protein PtA15_17A308 [Puccinia triticina]WAQ92826.1 hypothetical protein PtA15_17A308 [Puccinia triticina]